MEANNSEVSVEATPLSASQNPPHETNAARPLPAAVTVSTRIQEYRAAGCGTQGRMNPQQMGRSFQRSRNSERESMGFGKAKGFRRSGRVKMGLSASGHWVPFGGLDSGVVQITQDRMRGPAALRTRALRTSPVLGFRRALGWLVSVRGFGG